ncbi:MAG TPA: DUF4870 domain-containing protein [Ktedonobacterales bacterium]
MTDTAQGASPIISIGLREGGDLALYPGRIVTPSGTLAPGDVAAAYVAVAPDLQPLPDGRPVPAIALRLRDGTYRTLVPADPPDAGRFLEALYVLRPDLRPGYTGYQALPPGWTPYAPPPTGYTVPAPGYGYAPYAAPYAPPAHPSGVPDGERVLAGLTHLSIFFAQLIMPLVVWLAVKRTMPYASRQAKQAFFFQLILFGITLVVIVPFYIAFFATFFSTEVPGQYYSIPGAIVGGFAIAWVLVFAISIVRIVFGIYAAVQGFEGKPYKYPLLGRL